MAVNKVVLGNRTLIDLTAVTVTPEVLLDGYTAYDASGNLITGTYGKEEINLFDPTDADVALGNRINSSGNAVYYADGQLVTGFIEASVGDIFVIETDKSLKTNSYTGMFAAYNNSKTYVKQANNTYSDGWVFSSDGTKGVFTIPSVINGTDMSSTEYARFCIAYTDIENIKITKTDTAPTLS